MFRCEKCGETVPAGVSAQSVVIQSRSKDYPSRSEKMAAGGRSRFMREKTVDKGGEGKEIVRELKVCPKCAAELAKQE
jgi:hypothetical protein